MQVSEYRHYGWQKSAWSSLWRPGAGLPHALLIVGPEGTGKGRFARAIAARLLCEHPLGEGACGSCPSCHWLAGGNHPDFRHVIPEADAEGAEGGDEGDKKKSRQIVIDQIRALEDFVYVGGHRNGARVVVVEPAEAMNHAAANALLKILEEPPSSVYFILITSGVRRLLPTIRSRCQTLKPGKPTAAESVEWLSRQNATGAAELLPLLGGAPLLAVQESENGRAGVVASFLDSLANPDKDPLALAARWEPMLGGKNDGGLTMDLLVTVMQKWLFDLVARKLAGRTRFIQGKRLQALDARVQGAGVAGLIRCYNDLIKMRSLATHPLNSRLFLEDMAARYLRALTPERS